MGVCVYQENANKNTNNFGRTYLALADVSRGFFHFCRTYLAADTSGYMPHISRRNTPYQPGILLTDTPLSWNELVLRAGSAAIPELERWEVVEKVAAHRVGNRRVTGQPEGQRLRVRQE